jgi:hypothetical protein
MEALEALGLVSYLFLVLSSNPTEPTKTPPIRRRFNFLKRLVIASRLQFWHQGCSGILRQGGNRRERRRLRIRF